MNFFSGQHHQALLLLHGGAGPMDPTAEGMQRATQGLIKAARLALTEASGELERVVCCLESLEDDPQFNAGYGAALQADGKPRLTAALMDGQKQSFSGVISITDVRHPSRLALALQSASSRVLTSPGHEALARSLHLPVENLITSKRFESWQKKLYDAYFAQDTVGAVLWNGQDRLIAGTSTGGRGFEEPGRVSDSCTVAGTYASSFAAISTTGIGEELVDDAVAARIETRVRDGLSLEQACRRTFDEALAANRSYGWIACDRNGHWCAAHTTPAMSFLVMTSDGEIIKSS